ncbi:MAG TPA: HEAT repeat domain-containing protein [Myxococcota bacterium]|nr:HEAT repeat domain-containing protein [Myxococcota bacterium]
MSHPLLARLRDADPDARRAACREAPDDPSAVLLVDALCAALADHAKDVACEASKALSRIGARHGGVTAALGAALRGPDPRARLLAALAIARLGPPPLKLLPALVDALALPDGDLRFAAARLLVDLGRLEPEVLGMLCALVAGVERPDVRRMAVFALRELAPDRDETARALVAASRADDAALRRAALTSLAALRDPGDAVFARLCEALAADADPAARSLAASALCELACAHPERVGADVRGALAAAAGAGPLPARKAASRALERLGAAPTT